MESEERRRRLREKLQRELGPVVGAALNDPHVVEVMLNADGTLWTDCHGSEMRQVGHMSASAAESLIATIASSLATEVTRETPIVEGELPTDGSRFEGVLPPIVKAPVFAIRKRASRVIGLEDYVAAGVLTSAQRDAMLEAVAERVNIVVVGGTGSGKTTLANSILSAIARLSPAHRLVILEDTVEIRCDSPNAVQLRTSDSVSMQQLLRATMRLRPDRIIVGEVRGAEALALLKSWNTGHPGGVATLHANNAEAGLMRIEQLVAEGLHGGRADPAMIAEAVGMIVAIAKAPVPAGRRVQEVVRVRGFENGRYRLCPLI